MNITHYIDELLTQAIMIGASDLHFEPAAGQYRIRRRIDGILQEVARPAFNLAAIITSRLKIMGNLNIAERRLPQDGRFSFTYQKRLIDCRVSTCPTVFGEKVVLRILDTSQMQRDIDSLGFEPRQLLQVQSILQQSQGMIIVTGPTGSGKTVSLYALLAALNHMDKNICTVEDPVEIQLPGLNQVNVHPKACLEFATILRAFLRQDPDIIMVGEIRDLETAEIAMQASQTGHLVLSTLHTNSAAHTLIRLKQMGIAAYTLAHSVSLIIAQRLVRRLCSHCKTLIELPHHIVTEQGCLSPRVYIPRGCEQCFQGYKGRMALFELLPLDNVVQEAILQNCAVNDLAILQSQLGFISLRKMGLNKVEMGETSLDEVNRVTGRIVK
ncbi:MAG: ATPase, T2SS/T4P/T4SS family [Gammaproteobacteria bacterium]|nr:ATPase, T2SS/T4P/T4SS family [Gammaproteobacteria bacterium]